MGPVLLWDLADRAKPRRLGKPLTGHPEEVISVAFAPDGRTLASAGSDGSVLLWDLTDRAKPRRLGEPLTGHATGVISVAFAPDGQTLATAGLTRDGAAVGSGRPGQAAPSRLSRWTGHSDRVISVAFAPDGRTLATVSGDDEGTVLLWDLADRAKPRRLGKPLAGLTAVLGGVCPGRADTCRRWQAARRRRDVLLWDLANRAEAAPPRQAADRADSDGGDIRWRLLRTGGPWPLPPWP